MKYAVEQKYYDNGTVKAAIKPVKDDVFLNDYAECQEGWSYDYYIDYFETREEAEEFKEECLEA